MNVQIHPLAITCICDHYTRVQVGGARLPPGSVVLGVLFGQRKEDRVTIVDATDAVYDCVGSGIVVNKTELSKKITLWTTMDRATEFLGWYSFGVAASCEHFELHSMMSEFGRNLLFVLMDPNPNPLSSNPSFSIYSRGASPENHFILAPYKLETVEAERIAVNQVVKSSFAKTESAAVFLKEKGLMGLSRRQALLALQKRMENIISVLCAMDRGDVEMDHAFVRHVAQLVGDLQSLHAAKGELDSAISNDLVNTLSVSVLAAASRATDQISELNVRFLHAFAAEKSGMW